MTACEGARAETLFLRRQVALYIERSAKRGRIDLVTRIGPTLLSRFFKWQEALAVLRPETLSRRIANENPSWGEERIANELLLKIWVRMFPDG